MDQFEKLSSLIMIRKLSRHYATTKSSCALYSAHGNLILPFITLSLSWTDPSSTAIKTNKRCWWFFGKINILTQTTIYLVYWVVTPSLQSLWSWPSQASSRQNTPQLPSTWFVINKKQKQIISCGPDFSTYISRPPIEAANTNLLVLFWGYYLHTSVLYFPLSATWLGISEQKKK